jgi:hypothetical protein
MSKEIKTKELEANIIFNKHSFKALGSISPSKHFCIPAMMEFAKQQSIEFAEWMQRYALYDYSKHPYKYCAGQQPNGGRGKIETWTAEQLYNLFLQQTENQQTQGE